MQEKTNEFGLVLVGQRYALLDRLGVGGMGEVWRAHDRITADTVAVKILRPSLAQDPASILRFQREVEAMSRLDHPRIVPVMDAGADARVGLYFVMALQSGRPLHEIAQNWRHWRQVAPLVDQILDTLAYAHANGVIHRDIKPDNILIDDHGEAVLLDFGVARLRDRARSGTSAYDMIGTVDYAAPEQASGKRRRIGPWTDLYAFAIVVYELVCGRLPFMASTPVQSLLIRMDSSCPPLDVLAGFGVPQGLMGVLDAMMRPDPFARIRHAQEARAAFAQLRNGPFVTSRPPESEPARERTITKSATTDGEFGKLFKKRRSRYLETPVNQRISMNPPIPETRLTGRDTDLAALDGALSRWVASPRPGILAVLGEIGVGKSRFVSELLTPHYVRGEIDSITLSWQLAVTPRALARKLVGAVGLATDRASKQVRWWLKGHRVTDPAVHHRVTEWLTEDDDQEDEFALADVLRAACTGPRPLVLVLDNLDSIDAVTIRTVETIRRHNLPMLFILTARKTVSDPPVWLSRTTRTLMPLEPEAARAMLFDLVDLDSEEAWSIARATGGNPARMRAALLARVRTGELVPAWPRWQPAPSGWTGPLPEIDDPEDQALYVESPVPDSATVET